MAMLETTNLMNNMHAIITIAMQSYGFSCFLQNGVADFFRPPAQ